MIEHLPARPGWGCKACDNPWPCATAQLRLTAEYGGQRLALTMYLNSQHALAIGEIGESRTAAELYRRFLGWISSDVV